ncbi:AAA family ATPase [Purpureocillium lavendulum]|uniref:AAA family ATPase n=1 Tax=Purpureocillium lavendulum TaxID=1247861 RepID=A0AB34FRH0_9HYPO|nr:AAA family ATPase [Purpureocillium lavendulum]
MATTIPSFRQLLSQLGFGELCRPQTAIFIHDVKSFVQTFIPETNQRLLEVYSDEYHELAVTFLDVHGRGEAYWPEANASTNVPRYTSHRKTIFWVMVSLFFQCNALLYRWKPKHPVSKDVIPQDTIVAFLSNPDDVGVVRFTYSISIQGDSQILHKSWSPITSFPVKSLAQMMKEVPQAVGASGVRVIFTGPSVYVALEAFNEDDFKRLRIEVNDQVCRTLVCRDSPISAANLNLHTQIFVITEEEPPHNLIFSD